MAVTLIALPVVGVVRAVALAWHADDVRAINASHLAISLSLLASTLAWAVGIALAAVVLAWLPACALARSGAMNRGRAGPLAALALVPMLLPSYLTYHAIGLSRAPQTLLGDWLEQLSHGAMPAAPIIAGRVIAFIGLALWTWPLAALVMGWSLSHVPPSVVDALRVDGASRWRRHMELAKLVRGSIVWSALLLILIMLGSSVPLHLAQVPTISLQAWLSINIDPGNVKVWLLTWPVLLVALVASVLFAGQLTRTNEFASSEPPRVQRSNPDWTVVALGCLTCSATLLPLVLYAITLRSWQSLMLFLRVSGEAIARSGLVAVCVSGLLVLFTLATWYLLAVRRVRAVSVLAFIGMFGLLAPGSLVGQAWALGVNLPFVPYAVSDSLLPTVASHVTRFLGLAVLAGVFFARSEGQSVRSQRQIDAGASVRAWCITSLAGKVPALLGLILAFACLSLHEIDSSIVLQQPGTQSLAQTLLAQLHFARQEEMAAGAIIVVGGGVVIAALSAWLVTRGRQSD
jgi:ABC-type Fe3+ transport system permease subunit